MPLQIIKKEERLTLKISGSTLYYRRIPTGVRAAIVRKHTKRGRVDWNAVTEDIVRYVLLGWENVQADKKDIPFDIEMAISLPEEALGELMEAAGGAGEDDEGGPEKN